MTKFCNYLLRCTFTLLTEYHPLVSLLSEDKPIHSVATAHTQCGALTLSLLLLIKVLESKFSEMLMHAASCPWKLCTDPTVSTECVLLIKQMDDSSITRHLIAMEIETCSSLTLFHSYIINDWPCKVMQNFCPFWQVKHELSVDGNIIFRGSCVFIPPKFRKFILDEFHSAHKGITGIKALPRSYVWWPGTDKDI